jgi:hypothetical protein
VIFRTLGRSFQASDLAQQTFDSLRKWINVECGGKWYIPEDGEPSPIYLIKQEAHELDRRWKCGERILFYKPNKGGKASRFYPSHLKAHLRPQHIDEMIAGQCKYYYTGGRHGKTLVMLDVDAHEPWQTDARETMLQIVDLLGPENCFVVESTRGFNIFIKWEYKKPQSFQVWRASDWKEANKTLSALQSALKRATAHRLSCVEVKGTITVSSLHYGSLAKLPCYGAWSKDRLREFRDLPVVNTAWMQAQIEKLNQINPEPVKTTTVKGGSCDSFMLSQEEIDSIPHLVKSLKSRSWYCHGRRADPKRADVKLVPLDFAYAFVVLSLARKHRKEKFGEQMPTNFVQAIWNHLYQTGLFTRGFDASRWKAIRNTLADCGFLFFVDNRYWFDKNGEKRGKSMEWRLLDEYDVLLALEERGEGAIIQEAYPVHEPNRWRPVLVNPENRHYRLIERLQTWEEDEYDGCCCAMAA